MAVSLEELCKLSSEQYKLKQLAGERSMRSLVQWVHMIEDIQVASFLRGNELVFTTGIGNFANSTLLEFIKQLQASNACGLVVNLGPYVKDISKDVIMYCKEEQFPLFTVPWSVRLVDMTYEFCHKIIHSEENAVTREQVFRTIIFQPEEIAKHRQLLEMQGFLPEGRYCVIAMEIVAKDTEHLIDYEKIVRLHIKKALILVSDKFSIFGQEGKLVIVLHNFIKEEIKLALTKFFDLCQVTKQTYSLHVGISSIEAGLEALAKSYKRAMTIVTMAIHRNLTTLWYDELDLYRVFIEVSDKQVLKQMYHDYLGPLEEYDERNRTDYVETLNRYLKHNASVQEVAKETFVHRNTINYKLKKIKEILGVTLDREDSLKLMIAFYIRDII